MLAFFCTLTIFCTGVFASPWSHAFFAGKSEKSPFDPTKWTISVNQTSINVKSFSIKILWTQIAPILSSWSINGEQLNLFGHSPLRLIITDEHRVMVPDKSAEINVKNKICILTAVSTVDSDLYGVDGFIEFSEGLRVPFKILWDEYASKARLLFFDPFE